MEDNKEGGKDEQGAKNKKRPKNKNKLQKVFGGNLCLLQPIERARL